MTTTLQTTPAVPAPAPIVEQGWARVLRVIAARMLVTMVTSLLVWSLVPAAIGWTPRVIMSGSMESKIMPGDVIVTRHVPPATLAKNQVVTVTDPDHPGRTRTHRLVGRDNAGKLILRGDANQHADSSHVDPSDVLGLGVIRVPFVGRPMFWVAERNWVALLALMLAGSWCLLTLLPAQRRRRDDDTDRDSGSGSGSGPPARPRSRVAMAITAGVVGVTAVAGTAGPADAAFLRLASNAGNTLKAATIFYPYKTAVLADSPSFYWRLNETTGTAVEDTTTSNRDGTLLAQTYAQAQTGALASETRDTSLGLTVGVINANASVTGPSPFSVEAWIKSSSTSGGRILGFGNATGSTASTTTDRQLYLAPTGKVYFGIGSAKTTVASTGSVNNGAWHHVVGTYATGTNNMKLYVDGVLQGSATATAISMTGYWRAGAESMSGWAGNPTDGYYEGGLDELAVYPTVLSQTRVQAHHTAGVTP